MNPSFDMPCVILCGGKSSRMGEDKALLPFASYNTLVEYQYQRLKQYFSDIYLSSKINKFDFVSDDRIFFDEGEVFSPLIALETVLNKIKTEKVFVITVDTPFVTIETIKKIILNSKNHQITVPKTEKLHNLCGVYYKTCLYSIKDMILEDNHRIGNLLKKCEANIISFYNDEEFINLNKQEDYKKAQSLISKYYNNY